jgi:hypothetical protein
MSKQFLTATRIGIYAKQALEDVSTGKVMGATSKGVFLLFGKYSLFLTLGQGLSPFNITFRESDQLPQGLEPGDEVLYSLGDLLISTRQVTLALADAEVWTPLQPEPSKVDPVQRQRELQNLVDLIQGRFPSKGFLFLLEQGLNLNEEQARIKQACTDFTRAYQAQDLAGCLTAANGLFGLGGGLTPSGDDWLAGFILCRTRCARQTTERAFLQPLGAELTQMAYQKTTFVSANRLEAACKGWSEDLFLRVVDFEVHPSGDFLAFLAEALYGFGHSSGVDTLTGIYVASGLD